MFKKLPLVHQADLCTIVTPVLNINTKLACRIPLSTIEYTMAFAAFLRVSNVMFRVNFGVEDKLKSVTLSNKKRSLRPTEESKQVDS